MTKVSVTIRTTNLGARSIGNTFYGTANFLIKTWPAASGVEFVIGAIQLSVAALANVGAVLKVIIVLATEGRLGPLALDDVLFFVSECVEIHDCILR